MPISVIVADASRARILSARDMSAELAEVEDLVHPESRLREQDLVADGYGSGSDSGGQGKHSMGHEKEAHRRQANIFAKQLCDRIDKINRREKIHRIYLVAAPGFLGLLRANLSKQCASLVAGEVKNNLVTHKLSDIRAHLPRQL
jgi:protein required for attachment to host cells